MQTLIARTAQGRPDRGLVLSGLRGVGKTVLLNELAAQAETAGWIVAQLEAHRPSPAQAPFELKLARALRTSLRKIGLRHELTGRLKSALDTFESFTVKVGGPGLSGELKVAPKGGRADSGYLAGDLTELAADLAEAASERLIGIGIFVDELQDSEIGVLSALCAAVHSAAQSQQPFYLFGAGLPSVPGLLSEAATYSERLFQYRRIQHLNEYDSGQVLTAPASLEGVSWDQAAVDVITKEARGYPYFLQEYGRASWDTAVAEDRITLSDVLVAVTDGRAALDAGFYISRWERSTPSERTYLAAMATDGEGPSSTGEIATRLHRSANAFGPVRASLISKGLIYQPDHGQVAYTVPGMGDFVGRHRQ